MEVTQLHVQGDPYLRLRAISFLISPWSTLFTKGKDRKHYVNADDVLLQMLTMLFSFILIKVGGIFYLQMETGKLDDLQGFFSHTEIVTIISV